MASQGFSPLVKIWSHIPVRAIFVDPEHYLLIPNDEYLELSNGVPVTKLPTHVVKDCSANRWQARESTFSLGLSGSRREMQREITFANGQRYRFSSRAWIVAPLGSSGLSDGSVNAENSEWGKGQCLVVVENRGDNQDHLLVIPESEAGLFGEHNSWDAIWMGCSDRRVVVNLREKLGSGAQVKLVCKHDPLAGFCNLVVSSVL
ncbi:hypothetical protein NMY22_g19733 [Coprinellus aureogranulatus]|nr:hypothetical protein NMY22_g19733 [Coprinellus aureogranulatus]